MSEKQTPQADAASEFDIKHRITGAAVLLFMGALVLPWLLGPPSEASKVDSSKGLPDQSLVATADIQPVGADSEQVSALLDVEETVYISKITPLDAQSDKELVAAANKAADKKAVALPEAAVVSEPNKPQAPAKDSIATDKAKAVSDTSESAKKAEEQKLAASKKAAEDKKKAELAKAREAKTKREKEQREKGIKAAIAAESAGQKNRQTPVDVGWVVQVGLFTEKSRALALVSELKNKGFTASNSVVDTNRGPKTGTRVWLGPFAKRSAAQNEQQRLKSKAGKEGFIRVYP